MQTPKGHGLACTVAWTQLAQAMRADGMSVGDTCPPHITAFIREVVSTALASDTGERGVKHVDALVAVRSAFDGIPAPCAERDALDYAIAALRAQPAGGGEVVAWQAVWQDGSGTYGDPIRGTPSPYAIQWNAEQGHPLRPLAYCDALTQPQPVADFMCFNCEQRVEACRCIATPPESGGQGDYVAGNMAYAQAVEILTQLRWGKFSMECQEALLMGAHALERLVTASPAQGGGNER